MRGNQACITGMMATDFVLLFPLATSFELGAFANLQIGGKA